MLAESLKSLVCEQKFEKISVEIICARAGVTRRSFYHHFLDKYDLLNWIYDQDFSYDFTEHPSWTIADYLPYFCEHLYSSREFYLNAYRITGQNGFREHSYEWLYPLLQRSFSGCFGSAEHEEHFLRLQTYTTFDRFIYWLQEQPCPRPEDFIRSFTGGYVNYCRKTIRLFETLSEPPDNHQSQP